MMAGYRLCAIFCALVISFASSTLINKDVSVVIDATTSIIRFAAEVKVVSQARQTYQLCFEDTWAEHLSFLSISSNGKLLPILPPTM
jgi:hypothetical protein